MATKWVNVYYNTPKEVIKGDVENEYIRIQGVGSSASCFISLGSPSCQDIQYSISLKFKEGKLKFHLTNLELYYTPGEILGLSGWEPYDPPTSRYDQKNGKPYRIRIESSESTMDHLNGLADNLAAYLENPLAKEEDDW